MSISYCIACLDCAVFAPEIGASGYIGYPSADSSRGPQSRPPNFGYLYEAFGGIQLITWDMDSLHEFLQRHVGHRIHTFAEGEPVFCDGPGRARPPAPDDTALYPFALREAAWTDAAAAAYPLARFCLHCGRCDVDYLSEASDNLRRFDPLTLAAGSVGRFRQRMEGQLDSFTFMNAAPLDGGDVGYPDLTALQLFLSEHADHPITASMVLVP